MSRFSAPARAMLLMLPAILLGACGGESNRNGAGSDTTAATGVQARSDTSVSRRPLPRGRRFMVSSASAEATRAGVEVLRRGGNAVDAAVAVGFALAVTHPQAGNLGGGGFMVIRFPDGRATTIDYRERAPAAARRDMYLDSAGEFVPDRAQVGALAAGVPGSPAGMLYALERYGSLGRSAVLAPAQRLAAEGFHPHAGLLAEIAEKQQDFSRFPSTARIFAHNARAFDSDSLFRQPDLAATLERIVEKGRDGFYRGRTAELIVAEMKRSGGIISEGDLQSYKPVERMPIIGTYRGDTVISMPPPSSGGVLLVQMLNMLEGWKFDTVAQHSATHAHILAEVMRRAYADRAAYLGDPDFVDVPSAMLTEKVYARARAASITARATPSDKVVAGKPVGRNHESDQTTHYSVVDSSGMCVSVTTTLNSSFGCKLVVEGAGFFLNNEMDDFSAKPGTPNIYGLVGGESNAIEPEKRMLSSMTPTIVVRRNGSLIVLGTPGGSTIITTVLQVLNNILDYGMELDAAVELPRLHHQWRPDTLFYEENGLVPVEVERLRWLGYTLLQRAGSSGRVDAILVQRDSAGRLLEGWSDTRGYGLAAGE